MNEEHTYKERGSHYKSITVRLFLYKKIKSVQNDNSKIADYFVKSFFFCINHYFKIW